MCARLVAVMGTGRPVDASRHDLAGWRVGVPTEVLRSAAALAERHRRAAFDTAHRRLRARGAGTSVDIAATRGFPARRGTHLVTMLVERSRCRHTTPAGNGGRLRQACSAGTHALGGLLTAETYLRAAARAAVGANALVARMSEVDVIAPPSLARRAPRYERRGGMATTLAAQPVGAPSGYPRSHCRWFRPRGHAAVAAISQRRARTSS
jgi:hypothetical protein